MEQPISKLAIIEKYCIDGVWGGKAPHRIISILFHNKNSDVYRVIAEGLSESIYARIIPHESLSPGNFVIFYPKGSGTYMLKLSAFEIFILRRKGWKSNG